MKKFLCVVTLMFLATIGVYGQSGNGFEITGAVIAGGGGASSNGGTEVDSTVGQSVEPGVAGWAEWAIASGFWNFTPIAPTAASVSISGRVMTPTGAGLSNAILYLQTQEGQLLMTRSASFGYYMFENIPAGQTVLITVESKRFTFAPRTLMLTEVVSDFDFIPEQ